MLFHLSRAVHLVFVVLPRKFSVGARQRNKFNKEKNKLKKKTKNKLHEKF